MYQLLTGSENDLNTEISKTKSWDNSSEGELGKKENTACGTQSLEFSTSIEYQQGTQVKWSFWE